MILKSKVSQKMELIQHQNVKENPSCQNHWRLEESEHEIAKPENAKKKKFFFSSQVFVTTEVLILEGREVERN